MASLKVKFRPSTFADREGSIYYLIVHQRKVRTLLTGYKVFAHEWDERRSMVITTRHSRRKSLILSIRESIRGDVERLNKIVRCLEDDGSDYSVDDVICEFKRYSAEYSLSGYMGMLIEKLKHNGCIRTSETYKSALNSFSRFLHSARVQGLLVGNDDIMLDGLTSDIMQAYEAWLKSRGITPNSISFYMRILRAAYNRAVEDDIIISREPFRHVYTGIGKTVKRALPLSVIKKIKNLDLSHSPKLDLARDMFMLSFYLRGMSFIDMAYLKKTDLQCGHITYRRRKTGQRLTIEWTTEMQMILDKYPENISNYILPIIRNPDANERCAYRNAGYNINHNLKRIAEMIGINMPLTLYVARHSWASAAKAKGIPLSVISEGMGHDSEATTQIYLASLDTSIVDKANSIILKSLK
ncbi:MAG: tyrosine-type recombinase/integrase [Muribaculaceae bacterium]